MTLFCELDHGLESSDLKLYDTINHDTVEYRTPMLCMRRINEAKRSTSQTRLLRSYKWLAQILTFIHFYVTARLHKR
nr:unnamed protein product [Callosobruchus chinensis]